jgi:hypothetical protein
VRSSGGLGDTLRDAMIRALDADTVPRTAAALALWSQSSRTTRYRAATSGAASGKGGRRVREVLD